MNAQQLKNSILQMAIQGKLVTQNPNDEPASILLDRIRKEKEKLIKEKKIKREKNPSIIFRGDDNITYEKIGKNEPVSIEDELPFQIPDSWEWVRLGNLGITQTGTTPPTRHSEYFGKDIPFITPGDLLNGNINYSNRGLSKDGEIVARTCEKGSILQACIGGLGKVAITEYKVAFNQQINAITPFYGNKFLYIVLSSIWFINELKLKSTGTVVPIINKGLWEKMLIPFPPLAEQKRIVEALENILPLVETYGEKQEQLEKLNESFPERLKKSILQEAVQGKLVPQDANDEAASILLERIRKEKEKLIKEGKIKKSKNESIIYRRDNSHYEKLNGVERCIDDEIPFEIPDSWEWVRLGSILSVISDGAHKTPTYLNQGIPFLSVKNISTGYFNLSNLKFISEKEHCQLTKRIYPQFGDILFCRIGTLGKAIKNTLDFEFSIFVSLGLLRTVKLELADFIILCINSPLGDNWIKNNKVGGGTHTFKINLSDIPKMLVPIPPLAEQKRIVEKIEELQNTIKKL